MNTSKKTMIAAALAVAVVALAGVGYAALNNYTAVTINGGNSLETQYLELSQGQEGAYTADLFNAFYYDTLNYWNEALTPSAGEVTVYKPRVDTVLGENGPLDTGTPNYAKVSKALDLVIGKDNATGVHSIKIDISASNFTPVAGLSYAIVLVGAANTYMATYVPADSTNNVTAGWHFTSVDIDNNATYSVGLYIGLSSTGTVTVDEAHGGAYAGVYVAEATGIGSAGFGTTAAPSTFTFVATPVSA